MRSIKRTTTRFSASFWKRLWIFTVLATVTIVASLPAIGESDTDSSDSWINLFETRQETQLADQNRSSGFYLLDDFDSHGWADAGDSQSRPGIYRFVTSRHTEGASALKIIAPVQPLAAESLAENRVSLAPNRDLIQAEDWSAVDFVTLDAYLEEQPAEFPRIELTLVNSTGERFTTQSLNNGDGTLARWENNRLTFPLQAAAEGVLSDIKRVELAIVGYNEIAAIIDPEENEADAEQPVVLSNINLHVDNFKLNGTEIWDGFNGPDLGWKPVGDVSTTAGLTHNKSWNDSAGALYLGWQYGGSNPEAVAVTSQLNETIDWNAYNFIQAQIWVDNPEIPFTVRLTDGEGKRATTAPATSSLSRAWTAVSWPIPKQADIDLGNITQIELFVSDITIWQEGESYIDELMLVNGAAQPYDVRTRALAGKNEISWINPGKPEINTVAVYAAPNGYPANTESGTQICQVSAIATMGQCVHEGVEAGSTWFYSIFPLQDGQPLPVSEMGQNVAVQNQIVVKPGDGQIELGISPQNGAILYVRDTVTGKNHSTGSLSQALWKISFLDELSLPNLSAAQFAADSESAQFSFTPEPPTLNYRWAQDERTLDVQVAILPADAESFALKASINNQTGRPIRTVSLPHEFGFSQSGLQQALLPLAEGLTLQPAFFAEERTTSIDRPEAFADLLAIESDGGNLGVYMVQDSLFQANIIPGHDASQPPFQPNRLTFGGRQNVGYLQFDMLTFIPTGQTWESGTLLVHINRNFAEMANAYAADNQLDQQPTLAEKLAPWGNFDTLAQSPIYFFDVAKAIEWEKSSTGLLWQSVTDEWLPELSHPGLIQFYNWQQSNDPTDFLPSSQPVWSDKYGPEIDLVTLLDQLDQDGFLSMPTSNAAVWSDPELLASTTSSTTLASLRGADYPIGSGQNGTLIAPWRPEVQRVNDAFTESYASQLPHSFLFLADGAGQGAQYTLLENQTTGSAAAYTTAALAESNRLSEQTPIFTDAAFDQMSRSATGFNQSLLKHRAQGELDHIGKLFEQYGTYPLAAQLVHTQVAFYPHVTRSDSWGSNDLASFTHYNLFGYNQTGDLSRHMGEDDWLRTLSSYQRAVGRRTFGQPLASYRTLTSDKTVVETVWGSNVHQMSITANFDPEQIGKTYDAPGGYSIAPNGFHAMSLDGNMTAGIYEESFNGTALTPGPHWLVVEREAQSISVSQLAGDSTELSIKRPRSWRNPAKIQLLQILSNGSAQFVQPSQLTNDRISFFYSQNLSVLDTTEYLILYGELNDTDSENLEMMSAEDVEALITEVNSWRSEIDNPLEWSFSTITLQTGSSNSMVLRENNPDESFGKIESNPIELDFGFDIEAKLGATIVPAGASVSIVLLDEASGESIQLVTAEGEGTFTGRVADVSEWNDTRTVRVQIWVSGEDTPVSLDYVELYPLSVSISEPSSGSIIEDETTAESSDATSDGTDDEAEGEATVEDLTETGEAESNESEDEGETGELTDSGTATESDDGGTLLTPVPSATPGAGVPTGPELPAAGNAIIWSESFGPLERIWIPSGVKMETSSTGALKITENAPDQGFGRIEGETISANLLDYPMLRLEVLEVAPGTGFTIQIQEQGNAYDFFDAIQTDQPNEYEINLVDLTGWNDDAPHDFRILIWVSGEGGSITIDNLSLGR